MQTSVVIVGGSLGAAAAALALAEAGVSCVLTDPTDWIGGQLTAQAVPPDENEWIETFGGTRRYQALRSGIRRWHRKRGGLRASADSEAAMNPGGGWVSRLCVEPWVAHEVLRGMLEPHVRSGRVGLLLNRRLVGADADGDHVHSVELLDLGSGGRTVVNGALFLDGSDTGELYPLAGVGYLLGSDGRDAFDELHAPARANPLDQQAITWCFAIEHRNGEDFVGRPPAGYAFWREHVPDTDPPWPGRLLSMTIPTEHGRASRVFRFLPPPFESEAGELDMWRYRRVRRSGADEGPEATIVNWVQNDYWLRPIVDVERGAREAALRGARELSACLLHWLRTEVPRPDGGSGYPGLRLCGDVTGTSDGFARAPYIREPRRLVARTMLTEAHLGYDQRLVEGTADVDRCVHGVGQCFDDSVGIAHYMIDLHPSCSGRNSVYVRATPFRIPLGSLVPAGHRNVLAAGKALGVSHIANGATRTHAAEWAIGEAAGWLAASCVNDGLDPHQIADDPRRYRQVQERLAAGGAPLRWPWEDPPPG